MTVSARCVHAPDARSIAAPTAPRKRSAQTRIPSPPTVCPCVFLACECRSLV